MNELKTLLKNIKKLLAQLFESPNCNPMYTGCPCACKFHIRINMFKLLNLTSCPTGTFWTKRFSPLLIKYVGILIHMRTLVHILSQKVTQHTTNRFNTSITF